MSSVTQFENLLLGPSPILALAPMQDVTDLPFWKLMAGFGGADVYYTEFFRVHCDSRPEKWIVESIVKNPTNRPVVAQMIGNDIPAMIRTVNTLQQLDIAAIDLNLGCPAPLVYRKCAGGGLLREPQKVDAILGALRDAVRVKFTVKTRIGFDDPSIFDSLLKIFAKHALDLLTVHGRTVKEAYRSAVHYDIIAQAAAEMKCPVLANGNIYSAAKGADVLQITHARGLMIGRGAIRNPWIFRQLKSHLAGQPLFLPSGRDVLNYILALYAHVTTPDAKEFEQVQKMKKYMNFIGIGVEPTGQFLHEIRRAQNRAEFTAICTRYLDHSHPMPLEPFALPLKAADVMAGEHL